MDGELNEMDGGEKHNTGRLVAKCEYTKWQESIAPSRPNNGEMRNREENDQK